MKKERRWLKSAIAASLEQPVSLPWQRSARRKADSVKGAATTKSRAVAAR